MTNLVRAELLKLRTTRMFYGNVLAAVALVPLFVSLAIQTAGKEGGGAALDTAEGIRNVMAAASSGTLVVLLIGILMMAGEFRHNTATSTFLVSPDRRRVVGAKLIASAVVGACLALVASVVTLAVALPWLASKDIDVSVFSASVGSVLLAAVAATALAALVGVGLGSLIRNQTAAVAVAFGWVLVIESLVVGFLPDIGRWLPGGALSALTSSATASGGMLPMWGGALLFVAYGLTFAAAGTRVLMQRDV